LEGDGLSDGTPRKAAHRASRFSEIDEGWHEHVGCPKCGCEFGVNHHVRVIVR
jgi:hypothetical protein